MNREKYEKALEHIETLRGSNYGEYYSRFSSSSLTFDEDYNTLKELLNEYCKLKELVKKQEENRWIPVEERLPDKPGSYRVTCLYADKWYRVKDDLFYSDRTWGYDNLHRDRKVIAWKEIEEPYKR